MRFNQIMMAAAQGGGIGASYDADAQAWFDAVVTAGGAVSDTRKGHINTFILAEKSAGTWALTDDYWMLAAESATQALVSLKQLRTATAVNAPTFTVDEGYTGDATTSYIDTGFDPTTDAVALTLTSARLAMYLSTTGRMGAQTGSNTTRLQFGRIGGSKMSMGVSCDVLSGTSSGFTSPVALIAASRDGTTWTGWLRGVSTEVIVPTPGLALPGVPLFILANNDNGSAASLVGTQCRFACVGAALTAGQESDQYDNLQVLMTAIGANL